MVAAGVRDGYLRKDSPHPCASRKWVKVSHSTGRSDSIVSVFFAVAHATVVGWH